LKFVSHTGGDTKERDISKGCILDDYKKAIIEFYYEL